MGVWARVDRIVYFHWFGRVLDVGKDRVSTPSILGVVHCPTYPERYLVTYIFWHAEYTAGIGGYHCHVG